MNSPPRIAIALGASFMGYATHAGFLARLHAQGVRPVAVSGSSAGAITAGLYAAGLEQDVIRQAVLSPRLHLSFAMRTKWLWHQLISSFFCPHPGLFDPRGAISHFGSVVGKRTIESLSNPRLLIALSDLSKHETLFVRSGPLATAMAASSCVPMLFTMPVLYAVYAMLEAAIELRGAPWFGWIHDLSRHDPLYITPLLMGVSMLVQQKMMPSTADPMQQKMMLLMPVVFTVSFLWAPSGLVVYWLLSNVLAIGQQYVTNRMIGAPVPAVARARSKAVTRASAGRK